MDGLRWIHADSDLNELRELTLIDDADMQVDIKPGAALIDNTWSITVSEKVWSEEPIREGHYIYAPGTEWGGPVTVIKHVTASQQVTVQGPTWRGMLYQRRIIPPAGQGYLVITDEDAAYIPGDIIGQSMGEIFAFGGEETGVLVSAKYRYQSYAVGIQTVLADAGFRLDIVFDNATEYPCAILSAKPINTLDDIEISQDYGINFTSEIGNIELANHCLALGSGELAERTVINLYRVGDVYYTERPAELPVEDVRTVLLDYGSSEDEDELLRAARQRLSETGPKQSIQINELPLDVEMNLGDQINVRDRLTGLVALSEVTQKILTIKQGVTKIDTEISILSVKSA